MTLVSRASREAGAPDDAASVSADVSVRAVEIAEVALSPPAVRRAFADRHVVYLKGDWTRGDPAITAYLREHGRDGVPLYVYYPPAPAAEQILPQILTEGGMLTRLGS